MSLNSSSLIRRRAFVALLVAALFLAPAASEIEAHPLGNFTVNHFARIEVGSALRVHYVVDMAEIPAFQESQIIDANSDGALSDAELGAYLERVAPRYSDGLLLTIDGERAPLKLAAKAISMPQGAGGMKTLRIECDFEGALQADGASGIHRLRFEDTNFSERIGWREIMVAPSAGANVFDSTAFGSTLTDELKAYPQDMLAAPLDERTAAFSLTFGAVPPGASALRTRDGRAATPSRDLLAELINVREVTPFVALLGLLLAAGLGALHAFSPGHGKTVVGAYLVGSRGTAKHAAFLGLTVTITHTLGVFALGLVTLFASQYVVPERLFPVLSFVSGGIVLVIGLSLFARRLRLALKGAADLHTHPDGTTHAHGHAHEDHQGEHTPEHAYDHAHQHEHEHDHAREGHAGLTHSHGGREHSHLPPGAEGGRVTWRSLLALGISGGLLPCPSALVVLLSAISLHRVGYGLALVVAFSLGLAATLTGIGLVFVFLGRFIKRPAGSGLLVRVLPVMSAFVIACVGAAICYEALAPSGFQLSALIGQFLAQGKTLFAAGAEETPLASLSAFAALGLGLVFGLKHATEADHIIAVSTIVSEHGNLKRAALVGGLWGVGHTASLVVVGVIVLMLRVSIPERVAGWLEFGVALMIIWLGVNALRRVFRGRRGAHLHRHAHDGVPHVHLHFHEDGAERSHHPAAHSHAVTRIGFKPLLVGAVHGLAGSAALTLLVLTQLNSIALGLLYLAVFGVGSIFGMLLMSSLVGLPFALSSRRLSGASFGLQAVAGALSIVFGLWYAYETGIMSGL